MTRMLAMVGAHASRPGIDLYQVLIRFILHRYILIYISIQLPKDAIALAGVGVFLPVAIYRSL
ncbi:MAG: hypothetical protein JSS01_11565 [Proteobacteria bacterium]|nr:hypothetical protein [Pseudomonadota bacterium]